MPSATAPTGLGDGPVRYVEWTPVIAGAIAASALSFVLFTFGSSLGIALASSSPTWRDASIALAILSGLYIILITIASFGLGGYIAGRLRSRWVTSTAADEEELEFRDGIHGLLVWALAVSLGALLGAAAAAAMTSTSAPAATIPNTTAGEPIIAYDLDRLLRGSAALPASGGPELQPCGGSTDRSSGSIETAPGFGRGQGSTRPHCREPAPASLDQTPRLASLTFSRERLRPSGRLVGAPLWSDS